MRIVHVVGARPNFVKMAPVCRALRERAPSGRHIVVHTGQHYDGKMSEIFFRELAIPEPDYVLEIGSASHAVQTARVLERLEPVLVDEFPDLVLVYGDVNSTLGASLVAAKLNLRLAHVEAGLRSFDRTMPEEVNRIVADEFSDYLLVHSDEAIENLAHEGIEPERIRFVGNTMIDTLVTYEERFRNLAMADRTGLGRGDYLLVTLHRPALTDGPLLAEVIERLGRVRDLEVFFPVHPRTRRMLNGIDIPANVRLSDPLGYMEFLSLEADAAAVLTDSGGVQEETTYLRVPCFTLRANTERPVTVRLGTNTLLGLDPARIEAIPELLAHKARPTELPPLWDGHAAERAADELVEAVEAAASPQS